jgi:hypothetical protein
MVLLGDDDQVEARYSLIGDGAKLEARNVQGLRQTYHRLKNRCGHIQWNY